MAVPPRRKDGRKRKGRRTTKNSDTSPRALKRAEERAQVMELRLQGWSLEKIAEAFEPRKAINTVKTLIEEAMSLRETPLVEEYRKLTIERLEALLTGVMPAAMQGDIPAINGALSIIDRQRQLMGMDSPITFRAGGKAKEGETDSVAIQGQLPAGGVIQIEFVRADNGRPANGDGAKVINGEASGSA